MYEIETGIPIPEAGRRHDSLPSIIRSLEPEQSVVIDDYERAYVSVTMSNVARQTGRKFTSRKVASGGVRVWRVK